MDSKTLITTMTIFIVGAFVFFAGCLTGHYLTKSPEQVVAPVPKMATPGAGGQEQNHSHVPQKDELISPTAALGESEEIDVFDPVLAKIFIGKVAGTIFTNDQPQKTLSVELNLPFKHNGQKYIGMGTIDVIDSGSKKLISRFKATPDKVLRFHPRVPGAVILVLSESSYVYVEYNKDKNALIGNYYHLKSGTNEYEIKGKVGFPLVK